MLDWIMDAQIREDEDSGVAEVTEDDATAQPKQRKGWSRFFITIEPIKLVLGFSIAFTNGVTIDMIQRNICHQKYNLTLDSCVNTSADIKSAVEGLTADINMLNQLPQGLFSLLLIIFIGPWSDTNGRKPFILLPLFGYSMYYLCWAVMSFYPGIPVLYLCIPSIFIGMTGSFISVYVCTWSYTCDNFEPTSRPIRFSVSVAMLITGSLLGNSLSGQIVYLGGQYGYQIIYFTSFIAITLIFFYTLFILEETIVRQQGVSRTNLFDFKNVKDMFIVLLIRPEKGPLISTLVMIILLCEIPLNAGDDAIIYLVGKTQYSWSLDDYNIISAISSIVGAVSPILIVWLFLEVLKVSNVTVLILACTALVLTELIKALSVNQPMFWAGVLAVKASGVIGPSIDTELSSVVNENHMGKAFTMTSICDALSPVIAIPFYTLAYKQLLPYHTLYAFFVSSSLAAVALIASVGLYFKKSSIPYTRHYNVID